MIHQLGLLPSSGTSSVLLLLIITSINAALSFLLNKQFFLKISTKTIFAMSALFLTVFSVFYIGLNWATYSETSTHFSYIFSELFRGNYYKITTRSPDQLLLISWFVLSEQQFPQYSTLIQNLVFMVAGVGLLLACSFNVLGKNESRANLKRYLFLSITSTFAVVFSCDAAYFNAASFFLLSVFLYALLKRKAGAAGILIGFCMFFSLVYAVIFIGLSIVLEKTRDRIAKPFVYSTIATITGLSCAWLLAANSYYVFTSLFYFFPSRVFYLTEIPKTTMLESIYPIYAYAPLYILIIPIAAAIIAGIFTRYKLSFTIQQKNAVYFLPFLRIFPSFFQAEYLSSSVFPCVLLLCFLLANHRKKDIASLITLLNVLVVVEYIFSIMAPTYFSYFIFFESGVILYTLASHLLPKIDLGDKFIQSIMQAPNQSNNVE